jgi:pentatricopeptide repeat protein
VPSDQGFSGSVVAGRGGGAVAADSDSAGSLAAPADSPPLAAGSPSNGSGSGSAAVSGVARETMRASHLGSGEPSVSGTEAGSTAGSSAVALAVEGAVRKGGNRVRITAQLIDAQSDAHLWADRFDGALEDVFELQDNVAISVAGVIEPTLHAAEIARSAERPTTDLTAYDLYLRAHAISFSWERSATIRSLELLEQAIERDPHYGSALAQAATRHLELHVSGWTNDPETSRRKGIELSRQALQVAGDDPNVLSDVAYILGYFGEELDVAIALLERGLELNPSSARGWQWSGWLRAWTGQPDLAIKHFETSLRLNPREQCANPLMGIGVALFFAGRLEEARATLLRSLEEKPNWVPTYRFLASCYAHMGRFDEAREVVRQLRSLTNVLVPAAENWRDPNQREFYLSGLRMAIGEEK